VRHRDRARLTALGPNNGDWRLRTQLGDALYPTWESFSPNEVGWIFSVSTPRGSCDVKTASGRIHTDLPWPSAGGPGEVLVPHTGQRVEVRYDLGSPPVLSPAPGNLASGRSSSRNLANEPNAHESAAGPTFAQRIPFGLSEGDWVRVSSHGGVLALMDDGTALMRASELAQVVVVPMADLTRIVGRQLQLQSGAGQVEFATEDGKSNLRIDLGVDESTETHPLKEKWRVRCRVGEEGDIVDVRITDPSGGTVYRHHVGPAGDVDVEAATMAFDVLESVVFRTGDRFDVVAGKGMTLQTDGVMRMSNGGTRVQSRGSSSLHAVGDLSLRAAAGALTLGGTSGLIAQFQGPGIPNPLTEAASFTVANGSVVWDVGFATDTDIQTALSGFRVNVGSVGGDIRLDSLFGHVSINSPLPGGIKIGGPALPHPAPGWSPSPLSSPPVLSVPFLVWAAAVSAILETKTGGVPGATVQPLAALIAAAPSKFVILGG